ncbi:MAG: type II secretion system protein [Gammaproteobacteria bacterium]|nr:type II secretion system protein [Gammaproteobacteria bacterium]
MRALNKINKNGFTLVELAIVLVIIGVLLGSFIGSLASRIEKTQYDETRKELNDIKAALIAYAFTFGVLPCPDDPTDIDSDGLSDGNGEKEPACTGAGESGSLPWVTLGMGATDSWGNRYEYWAKSNFSNTASPFDLATSANGKIRTRSNDGTSTPLLANNIVAVIYSRGKNGLGAVGSDSAFKSAVPLTGHTDEKENEDGDKFFVSRSPTYGDDTTALEAFDDIVIWISEYELKAKMVETGKLP